MPLNLPISSQIFDATTLGAIAEQQGLSLKIQTTLIVF